MKNEKLEKDTSFIVYEIYRCHNDIRDKRPNPKGCVTADDCEIDPPCADPTQIDEWLLKKRLNLKVINSSANLEHNDGSLE